MNFIRRKCYTKLSLGMKKALATNGCYEKEKPENKHLNKCSVPKNKMEIVKKAHQWGPVLCLCHNPLNTPWNTNTHHHSISGSAGSAASPLALLTNRYSNNHLPSVLSGLQPMAPSSCLRPPSPLILGALWSGAASIH